VIEFRHVNKSFGSRQIIKDLSLSIPEGQIVFVLGLSGTGKSVLLKNIVGLMRPDSGEIRVGPYEVHELDELGMAQVRRFCGMVFQQPALFDDMNVFDNVAYGVRRHLLLEGKELAEKVKQSLALVGLKDVEDLSCHELSYGMKKRVSLARTIATGPKVLLFDEPTTGLDPISTNQVNELITSLSRRLGTTSVVVSHDMQSALKVADHILVLDGGGLLTQGSPSELRQSQIPLVVDFLAEVNEL
jgi:phospholipid/cholesterol/gamma-HCH transport system ATP-binding protein